MLRSVKQTLKQAKDTVSAQHITEQSNNAVKYVDHFYEHRADKKLWNW